MTTATVARGCVLQKLLFLRAVIGMTKTPSGRTYAASDIQHITQSAEGGMPFFYFAISSVITFSSSAAST